MMNKQDRVNTIEQMKQASLEQEMQEAIATSLDSDEHGERRKDIETRAKVEAYKSYMSKMGKVG